MLLVSPVSRFVPEIDDLIGSAEAYFADAEEDGAVVRLLLRVKIKAGEAAAEARRYRAEIWLYELIRITIRGKTIAADKNIDRIIAVGKRDILAAAFKVGRFRFRFSALSPALAADPPGCRRLLYIPVRHKRDAPRKK